MTSMATEPVSRSLARGVALFLGGFALLNGVGALFAGPGFDANVWWIDVRHVPLARIGLPIAAIALLACAMAPTFVARRARGPMLGMLALLLVAVMWNVIAFYALLGRNALATAVPLPLSLVVFASLLLITADVARRERSHERLRTRRSLVACAALACAVGFPLAQMICFGKTDYRRPADAVVVFGARAYADGRPSDALADRVYTGVRLYHAGLARTLVFSGGPGDGAVHETQVMRRIALDFGVPDDAILLDPDGLNTHATVRNTSHLFARDGAPRRVLAVSHFYHLPRIKLAYQRAGCEVYTVPADARTLTKMPVLMVREVAALWVYYLDPLVG